MSTDSIVAQAVAGSGKKAKKTAAFLAAEEVVREGLSQGASVPSLHRALREAGHDVGSLTWFRTLVKALGAGDDKKVERSEAPVSPSSHIEGEPSSRRFGDHRFAADYE